jgi:hypothetical protein
MSTNMHAPFALRASQNYLALLRPCDVDFKSVQTYAGSSQCTHWYCEQQSQQPRNSAATSSSHTEVNLLVTLDSGKVGSTVGVIPALQRLIQEPESKPATF